MCGATRGPAHNKECACIVGARCSCTLPMVASGMGMSAVEREAQTAYPQCPNILESHLALRTGFQ
jgi:hypothetical protein